MLKKSLVFLLVVILVATTMLAGCGQKTNNNTTPANNAGGTTTPSTPSGPPNPAVRRGNQLVIGDIAPDGKFNPVLGTTTYDNWIISLMFDPLLTIDAAGEFINIGLAERWEQTNDGKDVTFYLKKGVKFHNGVEVTAKDAAFTHYMIMHPKYDGTLFTSMKDIIGAEAFKKGEVDVIDGIVLYGEKPATGALPVAYDNSENDPYKITFKFTRVTAKTMLNLTTPILPEAYYNKKTYDDFKMLNLAPIGSGPYKFNRYLVDQFAELDANPDYFRGAPKVEKIIYKVVGTEAQIPELEAGTVDAVNFSGTDENYQMASAIPHAFIIDYMNNGYAYIGFNFKSPILQDKRVRQALTWGLNRHEFIQNFFKGRGHVAHGPISPVSWAYPSGLEEYKYNPAKANELLDQAGWAKAADGWRYKDGQKLTLKWTTYDTAEWSVQILALAMENWKAIGVELVPEVMEFNAVIEKLNTREGYDLWNMAWSLTPDPDMIGTFSKNAVNNRGSFYNERIEELMDKGIAELNFENRKAIYQELAQMFNDELPYIFVYIRNNYWAVNNRVKNFKPSPFKYWTYDIHEVQVEF